MEKNKDIFRFFKSMIAVRKAHPSLGSFSLVLASNFLVRIAFVNALPAFPETASASARYGTCIYKCGLSPADASLSATDAAPRLWSDHRCNYIKAGGSAKRLGH